ncbi:ribosome-binding factor A [Myxococcus sp. K38C18041901]|uniref:ribosome-binding factor A n=1 Tax=Myxococcus guangdongensis TaxID=2906760 RepID=UPI0020A80FD5|nr:ribosome-binding factor A [Myxococcus guangdongensis]MCP3063123.1 ribosome-binding factor A [Myxococcus guangdongensis]
MSSSWNRRSRAPRRREGASSSSSETFSAHHLRVQSSLSQEVAHLFRSELSDPCFEGLQLASFELTPDGRLIHIGYTLTPESESSPREVQDALARSHGYLRSLLAEHLNLKRIPRLRFTFIGVTEPGGAR